MPPGRVASPGSYQADLTEALPASMVADMEAALADIVALDHTHGPQLEALGVLLLCTESVASSKIEQVEAGVDDDARALHGSHTNSSAAAMVTAIVALEMLMTAAGASGRITADAVLGAPARWPGRRPKIVTPDAGARSRTGSAAVTTGRGTPCTCRRRRTRCPRAWTMFGFANRIDFPVLALVVQRERYFGMLGD